MLITTLLEDKIGYYFCFVLKSGIVTSFLLETQCPHPGTVRKRTTITTTPNKAAPTNQKYIII
jgi:hypothetical protein